MAEGNKVPCVTVECPFCGAPAHITLKQFSLCACSRMECGSFAVPFIGEPYPSFEKGVRSAAQYFFPDEAGFPCIDGVDMSRVHGKITEHDGFRVAWARYYETEEYAADMRAQARFNRAMRTPADLLYNRTKTMVRMAGILDRLPEAVFARQLRLVIEGIDAATAWFEEMHARGRDPR